LENGSAVHPCPVSSTRHQNALLQIETIE